MSKKRLEEQLLRIADEADQDITIKRTPKGAVSTSAKFWQQYSDVHPFIDHWAKMTELAKLCQFFGSLQDSSDPSSLLNAGPNRSDELLEP